MEHTTKNTINRDEVKKESNVPKREGIAESSDDAVLLFVRVEGESYRLAIHWCSRDMNSQM